MEMQKVLVARVKGGVGDAENMTRYIQKGISCGVLVLPDEVVSLSVEEFPVLYEPSRTLTESLVKVGLLDEEDIGKPSAGDPATEVSAKEKLRVQTNRPRWIPRWNPRMGTPNRPQAPLSRRVDRPRSSGRHTNGWSITRTKSA